MKPNGPVIVFAFDWVAKRLTLGMALDAGVVRLDKIESGGVDDVSARRMRNVSAAGAVALFAADVPLGYAVVLDVIVHRMTPVAERSGGTFGVIGRIESGPPIGAVFHEVGTPG